MSHISGMEGKKVTFGTPEQIALRFKVVRNALNTFATHAFEQESLLESALFAAFLACVAGVETDEGLDDLVQEAWKSGLQLDASPYLEKRQKIRDTIARRLLGAPLLPTPSFFARGSGTFLAALVYLVGHRMTMTQLQADLAQAYHTDETLKRFGGKIT